MKAQVMKRAWEITRKAIERFGGNARMYFGAALHQAWADVRRAMEEKKQIRIMCKDGRACLKSPYNPEFVKRVKLMGGRWNPDGQYWHVDEGLLEDLRALLREVYGMDDLTEGKQETVTVELTFKDSYEKRTAPVIIFGRTVASAFGRDTGARVGDGVVFTKGAPQSGGSRANWCTCIPEGCVVKMLNVPVAALKMEAPGEVEYRVI